MSINNLHNYELIEIFKYLNLRERQKVSSVCRKWRDSILHSSCLELKIFYFTRSEDVNDDFNEQQSNLETFQTSSKLNESTSRKRSVCIQSDKLLMQLDNPQFHKLKKLCIFANSSLLLADSYLNLTKLKTLESLHIDNLSLCLCLKISLERDNGILLDNLKFVNLYRVNLKILLKHFPNLIKIKCVQVEHLNERIVQATRWSHLEIVNNEELEECFLLFLVENCRLIEELKLNVSQLNDVIFLIRNLKKLKKLSFNCRIDGIEFRDNLLNLIKLIRECNSDGRSLEVAFNGLDLTGCNLFDKLDKFLSIKSEPNALTYSDLIKIDQHTENAELSKHDLESISNWCRLMHINQNLDNLRILEHKIIRNFINCRQLFFKAFDYDENVNDQQLKTLFTLLPNLISLDLNNVQRLGQEVMNFLPKVWPLLKEISISFNLNKKFCLKFLSGFIFLERLEFSKFNFNKTDLNELVKDLNYFTFLSVTNCDDLINVDSLFKSMYFKSTINQRMEYNLHLSEPYSDFINAKFMNDKNFKKRKNFFFID